jgi:hypothetical protein
MSIASFEEDCNVFYNHIVANSSEETVAFIESGGCIPVITSSDLPADACEAYILCSKSNTRDIHGQGIDAQLTKVHIPCISAAPVTGTTTDWAQSGGDPDVVPLQLESIAVQNLNLILRALTIVQRTCRYIEAVGLQVETLCDKSLIERGNSMLSQVIANGGRTSLASRVYIDNFNASQR